MPVTFTGKPVQVTRHGRAYNGSWSIEDGKVCLSSAYGGAAARLGRRKPETVAAELLNKAVDEWRPS